MSNIALVGRGPGQRIGYAMGLLQNGENTEPYLRSIREIPILEADEERQLAERVQDNQDVQAAQALVLANLRFVVHIASRYGGYGLSLADLIQEGNIGLMKAVKRFDPTVGVRLISFAVHWIRAGIHAFILKNWRIVKVATTKAERKLFFNLRRAKTRFGWMDEQEVAAVAAELKVKPTDVLRMEARLGARDVSLSAEVEGGERAIHEEDLIEETDEIVELEQRDWTRHAVERVQAELDNLNPREKEIVDRRWLSKGRQATLHELASQYGISAERIRQIQERAFRRLRSSVEIPIAA